MKKTRIIAMTFAALAVLALVALPAHGLTASKGMDIFTTPGGGATQVDLERFPLDSVFGAGVTANPLQVPMKGKAISGLGQTDTVVERLVDAALVLNQPVTVDIRLVGLSLVSENPVEIIYSDGSSELWDLAVGLSQAADSSGIMEITQLNSEGGVFSTTFTVLPVLRFSRAGAADVVIDCGQVYCEETTLSSTASSWVSSTGGFDPGSAGVPGISNGTSFDGDGDGTADDNFVGRTNFYPGFQSSAPYNPAPLNHEHWKTFHNQEPNTQCDTDTDVVADEEVVDTGTTTSATLDSSGTNRDPLVIDDAEPSPSPTQPTLCEAQAVPTRTL